jgi:hypothetical protein
LSDYQPVLHGRKFVVHNNSVKKDSFSWEKMPLNSLVEYV